MRTTNVALLPVRAIVQAWAALAEQQNREDSGRLKVFLDSDEWFENRMRSEVDFVKYVRDRAEADVCMRVTPVAGHDKARAYCIEFVGAGPFAFVESSTRIRFSEPRRKGASHRHRAAKLVAFMSHTAAPF
jgi:hypothetical protein